MSCVSDVKVSLQHSTLAQRSQTGRHLRRLPSCQGLRLLSASTAHDFPWRHRMVTFCKSEPNTADLMIFSKGLAETKYINWQLGIKEWSKNMITGVEFSQFKRGKRPFQSHIMAGVLGGMAGRHCSACVCTGLLNLGSNSFVCFRCTKQCTRVPPLATWPQPGHS